MIRYELTDLVTEAAKQAQERGLLPTMVLPDSPLEHPQNPDHGDYASTLPLKLARSARQSPMAIADAISKCLANHPAIEAPEVAQPGFVNFKLRREWLAAQVEAILAAGDNYGRIDIGHGKKVQIEYVSANPTGPVHVGNGRGGALGSTLANALSAAGYDVQQEYYVNDTGNQIEVFQRSLYARYRQALGQDIPFPDDGYSGAYLVDLAQEIAAQEGDRFARDSSDDALAELTSLGMSKIMAAIHADLKELGVEYDVWFSEKSLYTDGTYEAVMAQLQKDGHVAEREGARWFVSSALGEDKDNVLVRSTGVPTYFASDAAYHYHKFVKRGFDHVINIWGADHQGHISRMKAIVGAQGVDPDHLQIITIQLVTLKRGAEVVRLSKRAGDIITLREVLDEVGKDACRFFFLSRAPDSQMDFDLELAKRQSNENPVYYVQYAHARLASVLRNAQEQGLSWEHGEVDLLHEQAELALIRKLILLPEVVETVALYQEPHHLPHYAQELANEFHNFYEQCRIISEDKPLSAARLRLAAATKLALGRTLALMGMDAPDRM